MLSTFVRNWRTRGAMPTLPLGMAGDSHCGPHHGRNEDCFLCICPAQTPHGLLAVADGVGSAVGGEFASYLTLKTLLTSWRQHRHPPQTAHEAYQFLADSLQQANAQVFATNSQFGRGLHMATTIVAAVFLPGLALVAHAGDSRCYRWRNGSLSQLTRDHTWIEEMVRNGEIKAQDVPQHPLANTLNNCIGPLPQLRLAVRTVSCQPGDRFLLCSDGVNKLLPTAMLAECFQQADTPHEVVHRLLRAALTHGELDDVSVGVAFAGAPHKH